MPKYRATFVRVDDKTETKRHPTFVTNATDEEILKKEAASALRRIPFLRGEWKLEGIEQEEEKPKTQTEETELWKIAEKRIIDSILGGEYKPGTRIPTPHALATELGMSASSVYRAYSALRDNGWVSAKRNGDNRGTYVRARSAWPKHNAERD